MLGADVVVPKATRLVNRELNHLLRARRKADLTDDRTLAATDDELHRLPHLGELNVEVLEDLGCDPLPLADKPEKEVLGANVVVVEALRLVLGERQHLPGTVGKAVETISGRHAHLRSPRQRSKRTGPSRRCSLPLGEEPQARGAQLMPPA